MKSLFIQTSSNIWTFYYFPATNLSKLSLNVDDGEQAEKSLNQNSFVHEYVSIKDTRIWVSTKMMISHPKVYQFSSWWFLSICESVGFLLYFLGFYSSRLLYLCLWITLKKSFICNKYRSNVCYVFEKDFVVSLSKISTLHRHNTNPFAFPK